MQPSQQAAVPQRQVPWPGLIGVIYAVVVFFVGQFAAGVALITILAAIKGSTGSAVDWLTNQTVGQFTFILLAETITLGLLWLFLRFYKATPSVIGLVKPRGLDIAYALAAVIPYFLLYGGVTIVASKLFPGLDVNQEQELGFDNVQGTLALSLTFISLVVLPPITEEIVARGFLYGSFKKFMPVISAAAFTSLLFAAAHLPEGGDKGPLYIAAIDTFVLSFVLIYLREKSGSLWPAIYLHAIKNGIAFVALFVLHMS